MSSIKDPKNLLEKVLTQMQSISQLILAPFVAETNTGSVGRESQHIRYSK